MTVKVEGAPNLNNSVLVAGTSDARNIVEVAKVFGTSTNPNALKELEVDGVQLMNEGRITWMNELLMNLASMKGMLASSYQGRPPTT